LAASCGRIIFCNGAPSTGKTTLAKEIQARCPVPLWHRSLDDFLAGYAVRGPEHFEPVMRGYLRALRTLADEGVDLVAEAVIIPERKELYRETFGGVTQLLVGVRCSLETAQAREAARTDRTRKIDLDHPWWLSVHEHEYDLEVDTSSYETMRDGADRVVARFLEL
jgi:chloramphenicol 3-O phosphotransferase